MQKRSPSSFFTTALGYTLALTLAACSVTKPKKDPCFDIQSLYEESAMHNNSSLRHLKLAEAHQDSAISYKGISEAALEAADALNSMTSLYTSQDSLEAHLQRINGLTQRSDAALQKTRFHSKKVETHSHQAESYLNEAQRAIERTHAKIDECEVYRRN